MASYPPHPGPLPDGERERAVQAADLAIHNDAIPIRPGWKSL
jgi:hypothetical protein